MLTYQKEGSGMPVVLLHAFPLSAKMWAREREMLSRNYCVLTPDLPGFGKSPRQKSPSISGIAEEVAALLDVCRITEPIVLGGLSMGGYVAFEFLRRFPQKVRALMLFATRATADKPEARENRFRSMEALEKFGVGPYVKKIIKSQLGKTTQEKNPEVMKQGLDIMLENSAEAAIDALKAMAERGDSSDLLNGIRVPTLVVAGEEDTLCPPEEMKTMHETIKGSEFYRVSQSGHLINLEQPENFQKHTATFLKSLKTSLSLK